MEIINSKLLFCGALIIALAVAQATASCDTDNSHCMHPDFKNRVVNRANIQEQEMEYWRDSAHQYLNKKLETETVLNENKAKNIILFLGDGMSLATVAASRMYMGGEEMSLSFENFPHFGLSKTYCVNRQVADSACTSTAYLHGVKANYGTMGMNAGAPRYNCDAFADKSKHTESITKWAQYNCKATGFVTTSRVTHASPGGVYAHTANRYWENDEQVSADCDPTKTVDIARQLLENEEGQKLKVILGGGRREFRDNTMIDEEGDKGYRTDGRDLIEEWVADHRKQGNAEFIWNKQSLKSLDYGNTDYLMGLFEADHCMYNIDIERNELTESEPSLTDMTEAAIRILQKEENGFFLFVESARIDMAHHDTLARKALDETKEFSNVVEMARRMTNESDTLIIVTADHAHVMSYNGYPSRGNDVLGLSGNVATDGKPYTTISYANGMGYYNTFSDGGRQDISELDFSDPDLQYMSTVPRDSETHGGDDVGVYASGPWSHLFVGNYEQNNIPIAMAFAAKIGPYTDTTSECSGATAVHISLVMVLVTVFRLMFI